MREDYVYPTIAGSIVFYSLPILFLLVWFASLFLGVNLSVWVLENYNGYYIWMFANITLGLSNIWVGVFAIHLILMGRRGILSERYPPEGFYIWCKMKVTRGKKAKLTGITSIVFGFLFVGFFVLMLYASFISYSTDL